MSSWAATRSFPSENLTDMVNGVGELWDGGKVACHYKDTTQSTYSYTVHYPVSLFQAVYS